MKLNLFCLALALSALPASAKWSQSLQYPCTQAVYVSEKGVVFASNLRFDGKGGIQYSYDQGDTWIDAMVLDYQYNKFVEHDGDVYAIGLGCKIARTTDQGEIWDYLDYSEAIMPYLGAGRPSESAAYGAAFVGDRLYVADLYCGVVYTDDGDNWVMTDRASLTYDDNVMENVYSLVNFKGELYGLGLYSIFRYDADADKWIYVRESNCLCAYTIYNDMLVCGHALTNDNPDTDYLLATANGIDWTPLNRPQGMVSNYVRALTADDKNIYSGMLDKGVYYTGDMGETWHDISAGIPTYNNDYCNLISLAQDDKYLYAAIYMDNEEDTRSGIYRVAKDEMNNSGGDEPDPDQIRMTFNPPSGSILSSLSSFEVTFNCDMKLDMGQGGYVFRDDIMVQTAITVTIRPDNRTVRFEIAPEQTIPGEYTFKYLDWRVCPVNSALGSTPSINPVYTVETSGISQPTQVAAPAPIYNLQGIKVKGNPAPGIYIQDGKPILIKK